MKRQSNIAAQASTAALTTSRTLTSHLRRRYHARYKGRYRFSRLVFAFDLFLVGFAVALFVFAIALFFRGFQIQDAGIDVSVSTPTIRASDITPMEIRLRVTDAQAHEDVRLVWHPPEWIEVVSSDPAMEKNGTILVGRFRPGEERSIRLLVRVKAVAGSKIPFIALLRQSGIFGIDRVSDIRAGDRFVQSSSLCASPAVDAHSIVSGGSFPLIVANDGMATTTLATLRLIAQDNAPRATFSTGGSFVSIADLSPGERRVVFLDIGTTSATSVHVSWELQDTAQVVCAGEKDLSIAFASDVTVNAPLRWIRGSDEAVVRYENEGAPSRLFVSHPQIRNASPSSPYRLFALESGGGILHISLDTHRETSATQWSVVPVGAAADGTIGFRSVGLISRTIPFQTEARYYSVIGDQLGVGPLPPQVGETTTYWIVWTVGPLDTDVTDLVMKTALAPSVRATGKFASATNGSFSAAGADVTWSVPVLSATKGAPVTFAFEVEFAPSSSMQGSMPSLVGESSASAIDVQTGELLVAVQPAQTTELISDQKAKGKGVVR